MNMNTMLQSLTEQQLELEEEEKKSPILMIFKCSETLGKTAQSKLSKTWDMLCFKHFKLIKTPIEFKRNHQVLLEFFSVALVYFSNNP